MKHLGALGFLLFWMLAGSGIYLYARFDTSVAGAYTSIGELEWWLGGVLRSVHRYAADAFVFITILHLLREAWLGRFRGWRSFTWISGVPLVWLLYASGLIGYWLVWDARAQFSFSATLEWMHLNPASAEQVSDRLFSLFVFLHIGLPLALLAGMWVHVQHLGRPKSVAPRALAFGLAAMLLALAALRPVVSEPPWDPARAPQNVAVDWFYQFIHPLMYATSPMVLWVVVLGSSAILLLLPYLSKKPQLLPAQVDAANCSSCGRCAADCPYEAIEMEGKAKVLAERCAACGICAGACPSSTPFRTIRELVSGIELPDLTMHDLRRKVQAALASGSAELFFCCEKTEKHGAIALRCLAMLPPAFVEYALRNGAQRVRAVGCDGECAYRLGLELSDERFAGRREPQLRANVRAERKGNEYWFALR